MKKAIKRVLNLSFATYLGYCYYEYMTKSEKLKIYYPHKKLLEMIEINPTLSSKEYNTSFFFPTGHVQTILLLLMNRLILR